MFPVRPCGGNALVVLRMGVVVCRAVLTLESDRLVVDEVPQARIAGGQDSKADDDAWPNVRQRTRH